MAHAVIVYGSGAHAPSFAGRLDAARGWQLAWHLQSQIRSIACPLRTRDALSVIPHQEPLHHRPESPLTASMRPVSPARRTTAGAARGSDTSKALGGAQEPAPAALDDNWGAAVAAGRQVGSGGGRTAVPQLVSSSRRRMLAQVGVVGLVAGLCVCCPGMARADEWSYGDVPLPKGWGGFCNQGSHQSPIDIPLRSAASAPRAEGCPSTGAITFDYGLITGSIINTGHALMVNVPEASSAGVTIDGRRLELLQFHWHRGSEHTMDGRRSSMELHLVHRHAATGGLAVLAVLLQAEPAACGLLGTTRPGANLALATATASAPVREGDAPGTGEFDLRRLLPKSRGANGHRLQVRPYVHYTGSLTTPPCSELVDWYVFADPAVVEAGQVLAYEEALQADGIVFGHNARQIQPLGDRKLDYYGFCGEKEA